MHLLATPHFTDMMQATLLDQIGLWWCSSNFVINRTFAFQLLSRDAVISDLADIWIQNSGNVLFRGLVSSIWNVIPKYEIDFPFSNTRLIVNALCMFWDAPSKCPYRFDSADLFAADRYWFVEPNVSSNSIYIYCLWTKNFDFTLNNFRMCRNSKYIWVIWRLTIFIGDDTFNWHEMRNIQMRSNIHYGANDIISYSSAINNHSRSYYQSDRDEEKISSLLQQMHKLKFYPRTDNKNREGGRENGKNQIK